MKMEEARKPKVWLVTGVTGCGRIEMLNEFSKHAEQNGKRVKVIDIGENIQKKAKENHIAFVLSRILNLDHTTLSLLRALAVQSISHEISSDEESDIIFIGMHALFFWKNRLIPGVSFSDLSSIKIDGIITVVDDVATVYQANKKNPKWAEQGIPSPAALQRWMMEEELLSDVFSSIMGVQMFVLAKTQPVANLYNFFFGKDKKRIYLSYPITAIRENQELTNRIQNKYKTEIEKLFYVFNPLDIKDKTHVSQEKDDIDGFLDDENKALIDARTIDRDYRFISQSDAVVVIYPTEKLSPGVASEMNYAYSHQIPIYMFFQGNISPFLAEIATIFQKEEDFMKALTEFAKPNTYSSD